jgi:hypothetical protein
MKEFLNLLPPVSGLSSPTNGRVGDLSSYDTSKEFDLDGVPSAFPPGGQVDKPYPTYSQDSALYDGHMVPDIDTILFFASDDPAAGMHSNRQTDPAQLDGSNKESDSTSLLRSWPSNSQVANTDSINRQNAAIPVLTTLTTCAKRPQPASSN